MITPAAWAHLAFFADGHAEQVLARVADDPRQILPPSHQIFAALEAVAPKDVRVVILGQDPYPTPGHAHGLAFSVEPDITPLPKSLHNIYREMTDDIGASPSTGDLRFWAAQGVLLLNAVLTVPAHEADGHRDIGWQALTQQVLSALSVTPTAFVLWGRKAQAHKAHISGADHLLITSPHPSPLSAYHGFWGSKPFSRINTWLLANGRAQIDWAGG